MLSNFFKVTLRILYREKMYAVINIAGLSLAIACCIILGLYLRSEFTYDRHHTKHRQIYRVVNEFNINGRSVQMASTSPILGQMLTDEYTEVKGYVRFRIPKGIKTLIRYEGKAFYWDNACFASDNIFDVFTHTIIYGDPKTALIDPASTAVSESFARKYFGDTNPIGKTINSEQYTHKVTLVFADPPKNSHFKYDVLYSYNHPAMVKPDNVSDITNRILNFTDYTYLLMPENYNVMDFKVISDSFFKQHLEEIKKLNLDWKCWLQPLVDIHYNSDVERDESVGNKLYLYGFTAVAIFILLVACINYMNLATARASKRSKEVGMRKILGSSRTRLILQFVGEAVFFTLIALIIGILLVEVTLKLTPVNELLGNSLTMDSFHDPELLGWMFLFSMVLGLMSGIYPALYLSSILPLFALVGGYNAGKKSILLRKMLVLIQLTISVGIIACTLLMALQMRYISNKSLGFKKENRLIVTLRGENLVNKVPVIKMELLKNSSILGVSMCSSVIGKPSRGIGTMVENNDNVSEVATFNYIEVGNDFIEVMGMELTAGRDFSKKLLTDAGITALIINETMVKKMGWDQPLGKWIYGPGIGKVIGVVNDFHNLSLHNRIESFALVRTSGTKNIPIEQQQGMIQYLALNITGEEISRTLNFLEEKFAEFDLKHPFEFEFLDDSLNNLYLSEQRLMKLVAIFAGVCILISCMGLFGMAAFTTEQRTKEIGIRKVLGASTLQIITMLTRSTLLLSLGGAVIASLVTYYAMDEWLSGFAYRIGIDLWVFLVSAAMAIIVTFITVALQSFKTAQANPVKALRYE